MQQSLCPKVRDSGRSGPGHLPSPEGLTFSQIPEAQHLLLAEDPPSYSNRQLRGSQGRQDLPCGGRHGEGTGAARKPPPPPPRLEVPRQGLWQAGFILSRREDSCGWAASGRNHR